MLNSLADVLRKRSAECRSDDRELFLAAALALDRWLRTFDELRGAAQKVVDETDRIYDSEPYPTKFCAAYGAIVELRRLLGKLYGLK